jgi:predicted TIM-barrel fold metal-dependent hydrolase
VPVQSLELFDMHRHLSRNTELEKLIFPKHGFPDDWYWCNLDRVIAYMDAHHISHIGAMNVMSTRAMLDSRMRRAREAGRSEAEIAEARGFLREDMRQRVREMNDWSLEAQAQEPRIRTFIALDPTLFEDGSLEELDRCIALGATGVKLHPGSSQHMPDFAALWPVYERCQEAGVAVLACSTARPEPDGVAYAHPDGWRPVLRAFPHLRLALAHFCDDLWDQRLDLAREFDNLWFDISGGLVDEESPETWRAALPASQAVRVFRKVGVERLMWGSDTVYDPMPSVRQILRLPFTEDEQEALLARNAKIFFGLR